MNIPLVVFSTLLLGLITFFYRFSFISERGRKWAEKIPSDFLRLLAPAAFSTIIANNILAHPSSNEELGQKVLVASLAIAVAYKSKSILVTLAFGLGLLYALQNFF